MQKVAAIHDLAGFSQTSLGVVIPILTTFGLQVCPMPTAMLSSGTNGFDDFYFADLTNGMHGFLKHWIRIGLSFDAVYSGFLGSPEQVDIVADCIDGCLEPGGLVVVDPVMGDNGTLEPTMDSKMVEGMRWLCSKASCITPNLTEAALLLGEPYPYKTIKSGMETAMVKDWLLRLSDAGPAVTVITSIPGKDCDRTAVVAYDRVQERFWKVSCEYIPAMYPGTGDTFTSVLTGCLMQGESLPVAMDRAVQFVRLGILAAFGHARPEREGMALEQVLQTLRMPATSLSYTLLK